MLEQGIIVKGESGLHARPASELVKMTNRHKADISIIKGDTEVNGKSIMGILMLAIAPGDEIILKIDGEDEQELRDQLVNLFENDFQLGTASNNQ